VRIASRMPAAGHALERHHSLSGREAFPRCAFWFILSQDMVALSLCMCRTCAVAPPLWEQAHGMLSGPGKVRLVSF